MYLYCVCIESSCMCRHILLQINFTRLISAAKPNCELFWVWARKFTCAANIFVKSGMNFSFPWKFADVCVEIYDQRKFTGKSGPPILFQTINSLDFIQPHLSVIVLRIVCSTLVCPFRRSVDSLLSFLCRALLEI